ncbi:MAG: hypothetical protein ACLGHT_07155 [Acidimicrobiia bacterium]
MTDSSHDPEALPEDLDVTTWVGPYTFPDIRRRRSPGVLYLVTAAFLAGIFLMRGEGVLVNRGLLVAAVVLTAVGVYHVWLAAWPLKVSDTDALVGATSHVGFAVGHASAQLGWRGLRSRPTWRILLYSADDPPTKRGLVLVDGVDGEILDSFVEENPEDWTALQGS